MILHDVYMQRCLQLAELGLADVAPNPMVGAVLVHEGKIIGEGYHQKFGQPHAEVNCIKSVREEDRRLIAQSTLYISLEPCNHFGKTPPCTDLIIENKIPCVVIACKDPYSKVDGTGIQKLKNAGIEVIVGVMEKEAKQLNCRFFTFHLNKRPYIILKWAQTSDGFIGNKDRMPMKISNVMTDTIVHKWRSEEAAIMVGTHTALADNPSLTTRLWSGKNPVRIVVDWELKLPSSSRILDSAASTIVINNTRQGKVNSNLFYRVAQKNELISALTQICIEEHLNSLIVEGGAILIQSFIDIGLWDEARVIVNTAMKTEAGVFAPCLSNHQITSSQKIENDQISIFRHIQ